MVGERKGREGRGEIKWWGREREGKEWGGGRVEGMVKCTSISCTGERVC